ncbi:hypothetical protein [Ohtaekwangia koreensis]|uniref:Uncharacterized protein n=1 Tax=Ohtaekwangia koreensis TaxID=688867 RepID=A0A1T5JQK8_9BACT|nr:hypothetical protein [Ohtaekwangia koreensis]SKC53701.1 hypothetical protein SAMN05660236_1376 [Ohtaekwangia koreensis]
MSIQFLQEFARKASNQDLVDIIATKQFSDDELVIFETEVQVRGIERELEKAIQEREATKNRVKASASQMTQEDLFAYVCYNPYKFTETELAIFKNEAKARGLDDELSEKIKSIESDDIAFKNNVLNSSGDVSELLQNFNTFIEGKNPEIAKLVQEKNAKKKKRSLGIGLIAGIIVTAIGVGLTAAAGGNIIFIGAIVTGIALIVRGIISYISA